MPNLTEDTAEQALRRLAQLPVVRIDVETVFSAVRLSRAVLEILGRQLSAVAIERGLDDEGEAQQREGVESLRNRLDAR
jgi:hypothetical protein